jgi:hypothetical protein
MLVVSKYMVPKGYLGLTLYPFIILKYRELKGNAVLVNHERIHLKQQKELLVIGFYIWYVLEFLIRLWQCNSWEIAYRNITFEREAYYNETDSNYIRHRGFWSFLKYLRANGV